MPTLRSSLLLAVVCIVAASALAASRPESPGSEARAALGTIKDRVRTKFIQNNDKLDPNLRLEDLLNVVELDGQYYDRTSYGFFVRSAEDKTACAYALHQFEGDGPQMVMEITNVQTGEATFSSPGEIPEGRPGLSNSRGETELTAARDRAASVLTRRKEALEWRIQTGIIEVVTLLLPLLFFLGLLAVSKLMPSKFVGAWLAKSAGIVAPLVWLSWWVLKPRYSGELENVVFPRALLEFTGIVSSLACVGLVVAWHRKMERGDRANQMLRGPF